jgi:predicted membrane protein
MSNVFALMIFWVLVIIVIGIVSWFSTTITFGYNCHFKKIGKKKRNPNKFKAKPSKVHQVEEEYFESSENEQEWSVFTVKTPDNRDIKININIESVDYTMELDTDASLSLISEDSFFQTFDFIRHFITECIRNCTRLHWKRPFSWVY